MTAQTATPVTIIGGYLGAGKTTLVNHLLRNADGKRLAILVNEFGELPIDADLIEAEDDDIISLSGGCVCCSYGNDLIMAMMDMAKMNPRPDHIVLEASGVALPSAIANSLSLLQDYSIDGIVVLADAETVQHRANDKYMGETILRQLSDADLLLLNKADLISEAKLAATKTWLEIKAPNAAIIEARQARVSPVVLLRDFARTSKAETALHEAGGYITKLLNPQGPLDPRAFAETLIKESPGIVRAKGFVSGTDGAIHTVQIVGKRVEITPAPPHAKTGMVTISLPE